MHEVTLGDVLFFRRLTQKNAPAVSEPDASQSMIPQSPLETELAKYVNNTDKSVTELTSNMHILEWWREHSRTYPLLANLAKKYLAVQATSCSSERTFSTGGRTVSMTRTRLSPTNVYMMVYVKENLAKVNLRQFQTSNEEEKQAEEDAEQESDYEDVDFEELV